MKPSHNKTILIVDDEVDIRETISQALEIDGYNTVVLSGGEEALKYLKGSDKPDLILLDLMMPKMDGFEFIRTKESINEIGNIPTVVISASGRLDVRLSGFNVQGYLKKPISLQTLLATAEKYCG